MPQASTVTLTDSGAVDYAFLPVDTSSGKVSYLCRDGNIAASDKGLVVQTKFANGTRKTDRFNGRIIIPTERYNSDNSAYYVSSVARVNVEVIAPDDLTTTERLLLSDLAKAFCAHALVEAAVEDRDPPF